ARRRHVARAAFALRSDKDLHVQAAVEGLTLAEFSGGTYKTAEPESQAAAWSLAIEGADRARVETATQRRRGPGESTNLARALANEPGNTLTPQEFATRAAAIASEGGIKVEILDERQIEALGMGLLLGVARGSSEKPRLMVF